MTRVARWAIVLALVGLGATARIAAAQSDDHHDMPDEGQKVMIRAFGAVEWEKTDRPDIPNSFGLGQFALFMTSSLNDKVSVLAEVVMEGSQNTRVVTDVERLQINFRFNDAFAVSAGRFHTGIGYYNAAFHHGAYFETPIGRPRVFAFEDEGGPLPVHEMGVSVHGTVPGTGSALHYLAEVGNGRPWSVPSDGEGVPHDANSTKATTVGLSLRPPRLSALEVGASWYRDTIPGQPSPDVAQSISDTFAVYSTPSIEVMAEWLRLMHQPAGGATTVNNVGYVQASHAFDIWRPYYRYDRLLINPATPVIGPLDSYEAHTVGIRIDPMQWVGLKAQYEYAPTAAGRKGVNAFRTQLVFVF